MRRFLLAGVTAAILGLAAGGACAQDYGDDEDDDAGGLRGQERKDFVEASIKSCVASNRAYATSQGMTAGKVTLFCVCYSNTLADNLTSADLPRIVASGAAAPWFQQKAAAASAACRPVVQ